MRKGEILSLQWADIDFTARHAYLDMTKNGEERFVPLSKVAMELLQIVKHRAPSAQVVPIQAGNFDKLFRMACCRFDGHQDRVFPPIGGPQCKEGSSAASSSLRR
jgi:integrase